MACVLSPNSLKLTPCSLAQVYHPEVELRLNDLVEVIGVHSLSPDLIMSFGGMDLAANTPSAIITADILAKHPPSSLVLHSISSSSMLVNACCLSAKRIIALWPEGRLPRSDDCNSSARLLQVSRLHCLRVRKITPFEICQAPFHSGTAYNHPTR